MMNVVSKNNAKCSEPNCPEAIANECYWPNRTASRHYSTKHGI